MIITIITSIWDLRKLKKNIDKGLFYIYYIHVSKLMFHKSMSLNVKFKDWEDMICPF